MMAMAEKVLANSFRDYLRTLIIMDLGLGRHGYPTLRYTLACQVYLMP
jgi:hypothetical protein